MDADLNNYETEHVVTGHPKMTRAEWERAYLEAWQTYYTPEHMETILRRARASGSSVFGLFKILLLFTLAFRVEKVHPLQSGVLRLCILLNGDRGCPWSRRGCSIRALSPTVPPRWAG